MKYLSASRKLNKRKKEIEKNKKHITLILSGGAITGIINHLAFLQAWNELGMNKLYHIDRIIGTSAGAVVGSLYSNNITPTKIFNTFLDSISYLDLLKNIKFSSINIFKSYYFVFTKKLYSILNNNLPDNFKQLNIKFACIATNINNGKYKIFKRNSDLPKKVLSSMALPSVFSYIEIDNKKYIDGGILKNVGVNIIDRLCEYNPQHKYIVIDNSPFNNPYIPTMNYPVYKNFPSLILILIDILRNDCKMKDYNSINKDNYMFIKGNKLNELINNFNWLGLLNPFTFYSLKTKLKKYYNPLSLMNIYYDDIKKIKEGDINGVIQSRNANDTIKEGMKDIKKGNTTRIKNLDKFLEKL